MPNGDAFGAYASRIDVFFIQLLNPLILKDLIICTTKQYIYFLYLNIVFRMLSTKKFENQIKRQEANKLIRNFLEKFEKICGLDEMVYNAHSIKHLVSDTVD